MLIHKLATSMTARACSFLVSLTTLCAQLVMVLTFKGNGVKHGQFRNLGDLLLTHKCL